MTATELLEVAQEGDALFGDELQASIDRLLAIADGLNPFLEKETDVDAAREIGRVQQRLHTLAMSMVNIQIKLLTGQAKITAAHINAAVASAMDVIDSIKTWKKRIEMIGHLVDFFAAVVTGNGATILDAAFQLKEELDKA